MFRRMAERACAVWYKFRYGQRISGTRFLLIRPSKLSIARGARLTIGAGTLIGHGARIVVHSELRIGNDVFIGKNATLVAYAPLDIGDGVLIAENVSVHTEDHGPANDRQRFSSAPISIGKAAWIGAGVVVLKGVSIGDGVTVGANAVVTRSLEPGGTYVGVPARPIAGSSANKGES